MAQPSPEWKEFRIKDLGSVVTGHTPLKKVKEFYESNDYTWIKPTDIRKGERYVPETEEYYSQKAFEKFKNALLPPLSTCVVTIGTVGEKICLTHKPCFSNQSINAIVPDRQTFDPMFVYYLLKYNLDQVAQRNPGTSSGRDHVSKSNISSMMVMAPSKQTQLKISSILARYDDLLENNIRRIKILEEIVQATFREWFVNYKFPGHESVQMVESEWGRVPEGWERRKLSEISILSRGRSYGSDNLVESGGLPFLNLKCLDRDGGFRSSGIKRYLGPYKETQTATAGDIVVAVTDMTQERRIVAHAARIPRMIESLAVLSMDLVKLIPKKDIYSAYLYGILRYTTFSDEVKQHANGVNVLHLSPDRIGEFEFYLAPKELRQSYSEKISSFYEMCDVLQLRNANLRRTRDLLLPKLISGEIDVSDLDIRIPEAEA